LSASQNSSAPPSSLLNTTTPTVRGGRFSGVRRLLLSDYFVLYLTILMYVSAAIILPRLGKPNTLALPGNIANQFTNMWPLLAVAIGQTFVLIIGGIDLSVGATMGITSVVGALFMATTLDAATFDKSPLWGSFISDQGGIMLTRFGSAENAVLIGVVVMLLIGLAIGFLNGVAITRFNMAPFMVTLVTLTFFASFALWLTASRNVSGLPESFVQLGSGDIVSVFLGPKLESQIARRDVLPLITYPAVISLGLAIVGQFILSRTVFGRQMMSIGTNRRASQVSGLPSARVVIMVYMFSGFCAAVAAILYSARLGIGQPSLGSGNILLDIIGAAVIGGTSLFGGKGSVRGTVLGVAFFVFLANVLNAMQLSPFIIDAVKGTVILLAALLDITRTRYMTQEQR
jgi:ribose/xylose/arabinose/galactoside ABC-type transport system permease subunit